MRSTRRPEKECSRNVEVPWLMKRLAPDFKTLANYNLNRMINALGVQRMLQLI